MAERAGGRAVREAAYDAYADHVYAYAFTLTGSAEAAEEAVARAFQALGDDDLSLPRNEFRRRLYQLTRTEGLTADHPDADAGTSVSRELFELHERHGLSPADIALIVGVSESMVGETLEYGERPTGLRATVGEAPATLRTRVLPPARAGFLASALRADEIALARPRSTPESKRGPRRLWLAGVAVLLLFVAGLAALRSPGQEEPRDARTRVTPSVSPSAGQPSGTLAAGPTTTLAAAPTTPTPRPSVTPTPRPTPRPTQTPTPTPSLTPTPRPTPLTAALGVSPGSLTLARRGGGARGTVQLTATGGPVSWTANASDGAHLSVRPASGTLQPGRSTSVRLSVHGNPRDVSRLSVTFRPGGLTVTINLQ